MEEPAELVSAISHYIDDPNRRPELMIEIADTIIQLRKLLHVTGDLDLDYYINQQIEKAEKSIGLG